MANDTQINLRLTTEQKARLEKRADRALTDVSSLIRRNLNLADGVRYSWTQPQCSTCWDTENPGQKAVTINRAYREDCVCVTCGEVTLSGIFVRIDPAEAPYPTHLN